MSRPPYPQSRKSTGREQSGDLQRLDYLPLEYADLFALEQDLAVSRLGRPRTDANPEEADVTQTFMELSALVGHVLSVYQRRRAGEAYISTAQAPSSLVRHAHRLADDPDPGVAASGHVVVFAKPEVSGTIERGLALASTPLGEIKAQDYETRDDLLVDAALNVLIPAHASKPVALAAAATRFRLDGEGHGLEPGDVVALQWRAFVVTAVKEQDGVTVVDVDRPLNSALTVNPNAPPPLLAHPTLTLRPFGSAADAALYPPGAIKSAGGTKPTTGTDKYWYDVTRADGGGHSAADVYLDREVDQPLKGTSVVRATGPGLTVFHVTGEVIASVTFNRESTQTFVRHDVTVTQSGSTFTTKLTPASDSLTVTSHVSGTVTAIQIADQAGPRARAEQPVPAEWLADWSVAAPLAAEEPNDAALTQPLELDGLLSGLTPGRPLVFSNLRETVAQVVTVVQASVGVSTTTITWDEVTALPTGGFKLSDLKVFGNVARVSHGRSVRETLGGSDGVTPFQRFALRESPVTVLPGPTGGEPEIEVRVDDVLWTRVIDFADSAPDDRVYRTVTDEEGVTTVVFGDGRNGAVPPSGARNITAVYRVGLGEDGDVEPRRLSRLKRAHPLVDRVVNATPVSGGAEPAEPDAIRSQATRWIRTFDRAVSVSDLADLALTMPGIARAAARYDQASGVTLVVATASGATPPSLEAVRAFLNARRDVTVPLTAIGPKPREVNLTVAVERDPAYLAETVDDAIRAALFTMFSFGARGLGQPAYLSEVYARLEAVPGVVGVHVTEFFSRDTDALADVIPAGVDEWLRLEPNALTLGSVS
jgi:hypothetical protein